MLTSPPEPRAAQLWGHLNHSYLRVAVEAYRGRKEKTLPSPRNSSATISLMGRCSVSLACPTHRLRLLGLLPCDHRSLALDRLALEIGGGERPNRILRNIIFRLALLDPPAGVEEEDSVLPRGRFAFTQHDDHAGGAGVVKKVVRQQDYAIDQIAIDKPFADVAFLVLVFRAGAARDRAGVEHDSRAAMIVKAGERML